MQVNITATEDKKVEYLLNSDPWLMLLMTADYNQIDTWIDNNIIDLASARRLFKCIIKILIFLIRRAING